MSVVKVKGHTHLVRDLKSQAIIYNKPNKNEAKLAYIDELVVLNLLSTNSYRWLDQS